MEYSNLMIENEPALTVFSFGAGQESTYLLHRIATDPAFRAIHVKGRLLVVGSDTGNEHEHTYFNIRWCEGFCLVHNIEFYWLEPGDRFHGNTWPSLIYQYQDHNSVGSAAFKQTCTDNLKVKVVDRFTEHWIKLNYGYGKKNKRSIYEFVQDHGRIRLILGFAKDEEHRTKNGNLHDAVWKKLNVDRYYALMVEGKNRQDCIDYNEINIEHKVWPSNCMICFYSSDQEVLWLFRFHPDMFYHWVGLEANKLKKYAHKGDKNSCVYGKINLLEKLAKAQRLYGHWTDEQLNEYKFSHGHCLKSKY